MSTFEITSNVNRYERYRKILEKEYNRVWNIEHVEYEIQMDGWCYSLLCSSFTMTSILLYMLSLITKETEIRQNITDRFFVTLHIILIFLTMMKLFCSFTYTGHSFSSCTDGGISRTIALESSRIAIRYYYLVYMSTYSVFIFICNCVSIVLSIHKKTYMILCGDILNILPSLYPYLISVILCLYIYIPCMMDSILQYIDMRSICIKKKVENSHDIPRNENPLVIDNMENRETEIIV